MLEQLNNLVPAVPFIYGKAEQTVNYSREKALQTYRNTSQKLEKSRKKYIQFQKDAAICCKNILNETTDEFLGRVEDVLGVQRKCGQTDLEQVRLRVQAIYETIIREYILRYSSLTKEKAIGVVALGRKYSTRYTTPIYIHLKAVMLVSREMFLEFIEYYLDDVKMTYQSSKDMVTMIVNGKFNEENIKKKLMEGIDNFKQLTVEVVNKGLKIKIDRKTLMENYDRFAIQFLELAKDMREKSEDNIGSIKKRSRDLYKEVVERIKQKELQIKVEMWENKNKKQRQLQQERKEQIVADVEQADEQADEQDEEQDEEQVEEQQNEPIEIVEEVKEAQDYADEE